VGSCMTNIGHFRAASRLLEGKADLPVRLWMAPPTRMDQQVLRDEGHYGILGRTGARMELPGCSLCMGNQAQVRKGSTAMSTSTRNFPNRLGLDTRVYLGSAELAAVCALLGRIPTREEYMANIGVLRENAADIYRYMNFDRIEDFREAAESVQV
ncbi:MAG: aconitate hydratase B, partial [Rhodocyclales bacterium CG_4_10_14_3_um_filter_68_10]